MIKLNFYWFFNYNFFQKTIGSACLLEEIWQHKYFAFYKNTCKNNFRFFKKIYNFKSLES